MILILDCIKFSISLTSLDHVVMVGDNIRVQTRALKALREVRAT